MARKKDCGAPAPDPNDPAFIAATQWMIGTPADVAKLAETCRGFLEREVTSDSTALAPSLAVLTRAGPDKPQALDVYALLLNFNTAEEKHAVMTSLGRRTHAAGTVAVAAALVAEAWRSTREPGAPRIEPRLDPNRQECLIAHVASVGAWSDATPGLVRLLRLPIRRGKGKVMAPAGPFYDSADDAGSPVIASSLLRVFFLAYCTAAGQALDAWRHRN